MTTTTATSDSVRIVTTSLAGVRDTRVNHLEESTPSATLARRKPTNATSTGMRLENVLAVDVRPTTISAAGLKPASASVVGVSPANTSTVFGNATQITNL